MLWKVYVWIFTVINVLSLISFQYGLSFGQAIGLISLILGILLNIAAFSYAYKKPILSRKTLDLTFKANLALYALFLALEFLAFLQEAIGAGIRLPTSGFVAVLATFPNFPALYATYKLAYSKSPKKSKKKT